MDADTGAVSSPPRVFIDLEAIGGSGNVDADGMRADTAGNLYVTRYGEGGGKVQVFSPDGVLLAGIRLSLPIPTKVEFGGADGRSLFVVCLSAPMPPIKRVAAAARTHGTRLRGEGVHGAA